MRATNDQVTRLLSGAISDGAGEAFTCPRGSRERVYQAVIRGTGAVSATVTIEGSCDGVVWETIETFSLSGTASDSGFEESVFPWPMVRASVASLTGTDAAVDAFMGL